MCFGGAVQDEVGFYMQHPSDVRAVFKNLLHALKSVHALGKAHGDIHGRNVLLVYGVDMDASGVWLSDFGSSCDAGVLSSTAEK